MAMRRGHLAEREPDGRAARIGDEYGPLTVRPIRWRLDLIGIAVTIKPEPAHGSRQEVPSRALQPRREELGVRGWGSARERGPRVGEARPLVPGSAPQAYGGRALPEESPPIPWPLTLPLPQNQHEGMRHEVVSCIPAASPRPDPRRRRPDALAAARVPGRPGHHEERPGLRQPGDAGQGQFADLYLGRTEARYRARFRRSRRWSRATTIGPARSSS